MYLQKIKLDGIDYNYVAGHSLGEYDALLAAGVYDFETGLKLVAKRGEIYILDDDNNPVPIVMNTKVWAVIIDPQITRENRSELEKVINENAKDYLVSNFDDAFKSTFSRYHVIARNVPFKQAQAIKEAKLSGVYFQGSTKRVYPEGTMASGLLGFVNSDGKGQYGVEQALNAELAGVNIAMPEEKPKSRRSTRRPARQNSWRGLCSSALQGFSSTISEGSGLLLTTNFSATLQRPADMKSSTKETDSSTMKSMLYRHWTKAGICLWEVRKALP